MPAGQGSCDRLAGHGFYCMRRGFIAGETYVYTVLPKYKEHAGTPVTLPSVTLPWRQTLPQDWWSE